MSSAFARRVFSVPSPYRNICIHFLSRFINEGRAPTGTLIDRLVKMDLSPTRALLGLPVPGSYSGALVGDGVSDSIHYLISSPHYNNRDSQQYKLVRLLTKAF